MSSSHPHSSGPKRNRYFIVDPLAQSLESRAHKPLASNDALPLNPSGVQQSTPVSASESVPFTAPRNPQLEALDAIQSSDFSQRLIRGVIQDIESGIRPGLRRPIDASVLAEEVITLEVEEAEDDGDEVAAQVAQATIDVTPEVTSEETSEEMDVEVAEPQPLQTRSIDTASDVDVDLESDEDFSDIFDNLETLEARAAFDALDVLAQQQDGAKNAQSQESTPSEVTSSKVQTPRRRRSAAATIASQVFEEAEAQENLEARAAFDALDAIAQQPSFSQNLEAPVESASQGSEPESLLDDVEAQAAFDELASLAEQPPAEPVVSQNPVIAEVPRVGESDSATPANLEKDPSVEAASDHIPLGFESPEEADSPEAPPTMIEAPAANEAPEVETPEVAAPEMAAPPAIETPAIAAPEAIIIEDYEPTVKLSRQEAAEDVAVAAEQPESSVTPEPPAATESLAPAPPMPPEPAAPESPISLEPVALEPVAPVVTDSPSLTPPVMSEPSAVESSPLEFAEAVQQASSGLIELDVLSGTQTLEGAIAAGTKAGSQTYRFSLSQPSDFNLVLENLSADAEINLLDAQGKVLRSADRENATSELLGALLNPGDYQVQISASESTDYRLVLSTTPNIMGTANNLQVSAATYLGGNADDTASAVEFSPQRELIVAGNFGTAAVGGAAERSLLGSNLNDAAQVVRLSASGQEVLSITHLGDTLNDMDVNRANGGIAAVGDFGIAVLNAAADQVLWSQDLGTEIDRVAIANDGRVVTLHNKTVTVWSPDGDKLSETTLNRSYVEDVAIDPVSGAIYVAGYDNKYNNVDGNPVQVAFLTGYDTELNTQWSSWGYDADTLTDGQNDMADTRGYRITVGLDGELYFLGEVAGGNSVFRWNGKDRSTETLVKYDAYNDPYNSKSPHQTYYARINPETGEVLKGQLAIARLSSGLSNAVRVFEGSITADEEGNVYIGGRAFSGAENRDLQTINGQAVGRYTKSDPFALVVSSDFQSRKNWTTFVEDGAQGSINGFAVGEGRAAVLGTIDQGSVITTSALNPNAFNAGDNNSSDVYLATWGTDTVFDDEVLEIGVTVNNFEPGNQLQFSAADLGGDAQTGPIPNSAFVLGTQASSNQSTFLYANGVLSFDGDGAGSQPAVAVATLAGNPSLTADQIALI